MTWRLWILATCMVLTWNAAVRAQSAPPNPRAEQLQIRLKPDPTIRLTGTNYIDADSGISLADAIARALEQEPSLRATRTEVDAARGMRLQAGLRPNPTVSFMQQQEAGGTDNQSRLDVQWPLDLFRKTGRVSVAEQQVRATERVVADRERLLAADVRLKYGDVVAAVLELSISDELITSLTRQYDLVRARVDQGSTAPLERDMVNVELLRLEAEQFLQTGKVDQALLELKRLLGLSATAPLSLRDTLEQLVEHQTAIPLTSEGTVAADRPDVQAAEVRIHIADAQIDRARREGRFDLSLVGSYMRFDAGFPQLGMDSHGDFTRVRGVFHDLSAGAALTVPLRNQNQGEIASAQAQRAGATAQRDAARLTAETEIAAAMIRDARARDAIAVYSNGAREMARKNLDVVTQTYELGRATVFDVLTEQRRYLDLELAYSKALREAYEAHTTLRRARGDLR